MNFDMAFQRLIGHEGGFSDDSADPGGKTRWGISQRSYPGVDIAALTLTDAKAIYLRDYWKPMQLDRLPDPIRFDLFDTAVNSGLTTAAKLLQLALGVAADGRIGEKTVAASIAMPSGQLVARFNGQRLRMMTDLPHWDRFGKGWARRIAANLRDA